MSKHFLPQVLIALLLLLAQHPTSAVRDVTSLTNWARSEGVYLHDKVEWKDYGRGDWGLVLKDRVERGTVLLKVPRSLILDSTVLRKENEVTSKDCVEVAKEALGDFAIHEENFWIVLQMYRLKCQQKRQPHRFSPWLDAMPDIFPQFSSEEMECLPFYAKYAAQYQEKKFDAFCHAVETVVRDTEKDEDGFNAKNEEDVNMLKWAFQVVNSRFWKTNPLKGAQDLNFPQTSELVPFGDMFNTRDPPNIQMVPVDTDHVCFAYMGDDADDEKGSDTYERDLFLSYGQPCNPHRFLVIFGFVPNSQYMPKVWSHLAYSDSNPYGSSAQADKMVFDANDGTVSQQVWDAILWELLEPPSKEKFDQEKDAKHAKYKSIIVGVLESHLDRQLTELTSLRAKLDVANGQNIEMIRQYNEFLTDVFTKVKNNLHG